MLWHTEMACGVHLGILLICLVQAEHVRCLWDTQAQSSQRQNGNAYVGFLQPDSVVRELGGSSSQNKLRQASIYPRSAQSSRFSAQTAVNSGYNRGLSSGSYTQPTQSGRASVRLVQSSSVSKPNLEVINLKRVNTQNVPNKLSFGLSTAIASGRALSKHSQNQSHRTKNGKRRTWPVQQGSLRTSKYPSSSSVQSPFREPGALASSSHQFPAQRPRSAAAKAPAPYGQGDSTRVSSSLFSSGAYVPQQNPVTTQTSASVAARRVSSFHGTKASNPSSFSSAQNERVRNMPSQTEAGNPFKSKLFPVSGASVQESYKPISNIASSHVGYTHSLPVPYKHNSAGGVEPRSQKASIGQRFNYNPSSTSTGQDRSASSSVQALSSIRYPTQGAHNVAASSTSGAGTSPQRFHPTRVHSIPQHFGGFAIRRLTDPVDRNKPEVAQKPQWSYSDPSQQTASYQPPHQSVHHKSTWKRIKLHQKQVQQDD